MPALISSPSSRQAWRAAFIASWWLVYPAFVLLTARLAYERACGDPLQPLARLMTVPATAWPIAAVYVCAHAWLVVALIQLASGADGAGSSRSRQFHIAFVLMAVAVGLEHLPVAAGRLAGASLIGCVPAS